MHSMTRRNSSEMSSLWASNNRIIRSTRSANHSTTSQKLYLHKQQDYKIHSFRQPFHHLTEIIPAQTTGLYDPLVPPTIPPPHRNYTCTNNRMIRSTRSANHSITSQKLYLHKQQDYTIQLNQQLREYKPPSATNTTVTGPVRELKLYLLNLY